MLRGADFKKDIEPILENYCYDCHADGIKKGGVAFDEFKTEAGAAENRDFWLKALKNLRSGLMPPAKKAQPTDAERQLVMDWIKADAFGIDPKNPDPGRVTVRRLNRVEYHNTIRDLLGVDYDTDTAFPPDDTGNGFDNNGDVLTLSPMLLEKYLNAAQEIVARAVPLTSKVVAERVLRGEGTGGGGVTFSYYEKAASTNRFKVEQGGHYQLLLNLLGNERFVDNEFDYNRCRFLVRLDDVEIFRQEYYREGGRKLHYEINQTLSAGEHALVLEVQPLEPAQKQVRALALRVNAVTLRGPDDEKFYVRPGNYRRFFPKDVPGSAAGRREYARELLKNFAGRAFRRPVDDKTVERLVKVAETTYTQPHQAFEAGIGQAMVAVLASPRFLFREEGLEPVEGKASVALVDEYSLAARLSYFLWSSMPDEELVRLADTHLLRKNLEAQISRMLADPRSEALARNFAGQWLQTRDIMIVPVKAGAVLARDGVKAEDKEAANALGPRRFQRNFSEAEMDFGLRRDMRREADMYFDFIMQGDRDVAEFLESDYTFLNARLARLYGLENLKVTGEELHRVVLPEDSTRGGVLTMGAVLAVTSNPTRTSPVKRGLFILDNILGTPSPPPPPNIPPLEDSESGVKGHSPTLREVLAVHREQPMCASCHDRLDPPGLAMENFNALGMWRDKDRGQPVEAAGQLITGENFGNVRELKHILATKHRTDFYRCLTEKMLMYALGRGLEYYDVGTVDGIVGQLQENGGRFSSLVGGVIGSAPFQKSRMGARLSANWKFQPWRVPPRDANSL